MDRKQSQATAGPAFFGHALLDSALPPLPPGSPARMPLALTSEWQAFCKGNMHFDLENLVLSKIPRIYISGKGT